MGYGLVLTEAYGLVEARLPYDPAPLICEGLCRVVTMHKFVESRRAAGGFGVVYVNSPTHDLYMCIECGVERIWG